MRGKKFFALALATIMTLTTAVSAFAIDDAEGIEAAAAAGQQEFDFDPTEGDPIEIKVATIHLDGSVGVRCLEAMKKYIEDVTGGRITVTLYAGGVLGDYTAALEMLNEGDIQMDVVNPVSFETQIPTLALINNYYTFDDLDHLHRFFEGEGGDMVYNSWNQVGLQGMALLSLGFRELYNSRGPINTLEDLKGLKIRGYSTIQQAAWEAVGVEPVSIQWDELFVSLQQKLIDGEEGAIVNFEDYSFHEVQPYFAMTDHVFSCDMLISNEAWIESLSENDQALVYAAADVCYTYHRDHYIPENEALLEKFASEYGTEITYLDDSVKQEMREAMQPVTEKLIVELTGQDLYDEYMGYVEDARA